MKTEGFYRFYKSQLNNSSISSIEEADLVVFINSRQCFEFEQYREEHEFALKINKLMICISFVNYDSYLIDNHFRDMKMIRIIEDSERDEENKNELNLLHILLSNTLKIQKSSETIDYSSSIQVYSVSKISIEENFYKLEIISDDELIYNIKSSRSLKILNIHSGDIVNDIDTQSSQIKSFCWIDHLSQVLVSFSEFNNDCKLFNRDGLSVKKVRLYENIHYSMGYNRFNKKTYFVSTKNVLIFDENLNHRITSNSLAKLCVDALGEKLYVPRLNQLNVLNLKRKVLATVVLESKIRSLKTDLKNPSTIVYILLDNSIKIFNAKSLSIIGSIDMPFNLDLRMIYENKLLFRNCEGNFLTYKMSLENLKLSIDQKFTCKFNRFNPHLYKEPYLLPCGNSACLSCIYKNFNLHTQSIECDFDFCKEDHFLKLDLKRDTELDILINTNIRLLMASMIDCGSSLSSRLTGN